jgi:hypothetical protein
MWMWRTERGESPARQLIGVAFLEGIGLQRLQLRAPESRYQVVPDAVGVPGGGAWAPPAPVSFDALCEAVEAVEGVRFREGFGRLPGRAATGDEGLRAVLDRARALAAQAPAAPPTAPD